MNQGNWTKWWRWIKTESLRVLPAFIFFFVAFYVINMIEGLFLKSHGIPPFSFYTVVIAAALIAKILLVINQLPFVNAFPHKPLICNVLWKTFLYESCTFIVRIALLIVPEMITTWSFSAGYTKFITVFDSQRFIAVQLCYLLLFLTFVSAQEATIAFGPQKVRKMFFGR